MRARPQPIERRPEEVPAERKAELLRELDERARARGRRGRPGRWPATPRRRREVAVANSDGLLSGDDRTRVRLGAQVVARRGDRVETGAETLGGHRGFELFDDDPGAIADEAARKALTMLDAGPAPAGSMPVVVGGGFGGVLFHEMTGHGLEADAVQKGASVYAGKLGEQVAAAAADRLRRRPMPGEWGTDAIDDEGTPTQATRVIEDGRARLLPLRPPARRARRRRLDRQRPPRELPPPADPAHDQHLHRPGRRRRPRRSSPTSSSGFYAVSFAGGQVEPATGDFVFGVSEGYLIEDGKVTRPCAARR